MADHGRNALHAAARAMDEVVLPALDRTHPLAVEQATLVSRYLKFFAQRMDHGYERNRFELIHYTALAKSLAGNAREVSPAIGQALDAAIAKSLEIQSHPVARQSQQQAIAQELGGILCALVRTTADLADGAQGLIIERRILEASRTLLDMQRAWFAPQGWEPDPTALPSLDDVLNRPVG